MPKFIITESYLYEIHADNADAATDLFNDWAGEGMPDDYPDAPVFLDNQVDAALATIFNTTTDN